MFADLKGKKILVTGACGSIGSVVAKTLSCEGALVVAFDLSEEKLNQMQQQNGFYLYKGLDLTDSNAIAEALKQVTADGIKFSGLVHCAGGGKTLPLRVLKKEHLLEAMQINFFAFVDLVKQITNKKYFSNAGGSIMGFSSYAAMDGEMGQTAYSAAKAAVDAAVRTLSYELASKNIRINSVRPGMIASNAVDKMADDIGQEEFAKQVGKQLLGLGKPQDVANLCAFLISDAGKFMTGRNVYLDGGRFK